MLRLPVSFFSFFSFSVPATRPSTRIQRRVQLTGSRRQSSRRRTHSTTTTQRQAVSVVSSVEEAPTATTSAEGAHIILLGR